MSELGPLHRPRSSTGCCRRSTASATPSRAASCASSSRCSPTRSNVLAESLEQVYDDQFIETCAPWVAPYIGDLIGYRTLHGVVPQVASPRAEVANTIRYRRRKGTVSVLEQLARDVTGWPARAVEFFELLATTQYMNHVRPHAAATADLRERGAARARRRLPGRRVRRPRAHGRDAADRVAVRAGTTSRTSASSSGGSQALRLAGSPLVEADASGPALPLRPARDRQAALRRAAHRGGRSRTWPSRSTCRCRCSAGSLVGEPRPSSTAPGARCCSSGDRRAASTRCPSTTSASATSPTTRPRPARGRTSRSPPTRTSRSTRCSAASPSPPRRRPARRGSRPSTTARRSRSAAAATTAPRRSSRLETRRAGRGRRRPRAAARLGRRRRRGADPRQPPLRRAGHDRRDDAGAVRGRPRAHAPRREPHAAAARARRPAHARDGSRHDRRAGRARARRRAARDRGGRRHASRARSSSATARSCPGSRATPTASRAPSAARA